MIPRVAVVTVSDSCAAGEREDASGPALVERCVAKGWEAALVAVVPDERERIAGTLRVLAASGLYDAMLTTGGTGVSPRDVTPEAVRTLLDKEIPGLGEQMRAVGLTHTPRAVLSRSLAGASGHVFIACLPGSPKGAVESLETIASLIPHVCDLLQGRTGH